MSCHARFRFSTLTASNSVEDSCIFSFVYVEQKVMSWKYVIPVGSKVWSLLFSRLKIPLCFSCLHLEQKECRRTLSQHAGLMLSDNHSAKDP